MVAKELKKMSLTEDLLAATPPLEAKKILFSMAVTEGIGFKGGDRIKGMKTDFSDVRRAYFHAAAGTRMYFKLPPEDHTDGMCGLVEKSMYGTRDAAQSWEIEYSQFMNNVGFKRGPGMPCVLYQPLRNLRIVMHADDFTALGHESQLDWFRQVIEKNLKSSSEGG